MPAPEWDALLSLGCATIFGGAIGLNRQLHRKPAGLRTHALVSLGAALAAWLAIHLAGADAGAGSRVMQGVVTGIGFLGAGVIIHHDAESRVEGLTTAASVWVAAMLGLGCGAGMMLVSGLALVIALLVLVVGAFLEIAFTRLFNRHDNDL